MRERVVILGAAGFIGRVLRKHLGGRYALTSVDREWRSPPGEAYERQLTMDVGDPAAVEQLMVDMELEGNNLAGVIDLVAHYDFKNKPDPRYRSVETGLEILLKRMGERLASHVPFLYASSMASLEPTEPGRKLSEQSPRAGHWAYPAHKVRCEKIMEAADIPQPRVQLVLAAVYSDWCELVPLYKQIERVRASTLANFYPGPTDRGLTYVHVEDVARAFERALVVGRGSNGVMRQLVGEDAPVTYQQIQDTASEIFHGNKGTVLRVPRILAKTGAAVLGAVGSEDFIKPWMIDFAGEHFEFDLSSTRSVLDWNPRHDLQLELAPMIQRAHGDPERWRTLNDARPY
ncbi:MAG: NAD(P)-dependent oxidoreductase [Myxococcota bacterium]